MYKSRYQILLFCQSSGILTWNWNQKQQSFLYLQIFSASEEIRLVSYFTLFHDRQNLEEFILQDTAQKLKKKESTSSDVTE